MKLSKSTPACLIALVALLASLPCHALFKVVGPDGKVTYTDRPPPAAAGEARPVAERDAGAGDVSLPYALRQAVSRYPVTLYTQSNCGACDSGRRWLRERGVPFVEKTVTSNEEGKALVQRVGGSDLPALTIGSDAVRGYSAAEWASLFDVAGYPATSQLPRNYRYAAASPLIPPPAAPASAPPAEPDAAVQAPLPTPPPITADNPTGIRF